MPRPVPILLLIASVFIVDSALVAAQDADLDPWRYLPSTFAQAQDVSTSSIQVYELGISFATEPELRLLGLRLPWIALGCRFGDVFSGIRLSFSFPF